MLGDQRIEEVARRARVQRLPREATRTELLRVHREAHVARVAASAGRTVRFDADTQASPHTYRAALKAAGASYANIVKITTFGVGYKPELRPIIGKARSAFFEGMEPPASTLVGVTALAAPEWLIEIEAVAVVD